MRKLGLVCAVLFALAFPLAAAPAPAVDPVPPHVSGAVADAGRPEADRSRDVNRKPAQLVAFAGIEPGDKVLDLLPGRGYFTRIFAKAVGPGGTVYALVPKEAVDRRPQAADAVKAIAADPAYPNVRVQVAPVAQVAAPEPLDVVWTSDNYHDLKNPGLGPADTAALNRAVFAALKPGGVYFVLDHAAEAGSGIRDTSTLHRIDPDVVKREVLAAGFVLEAESDLLRNPADDHSGPVADGPLRGSTDQFVYRFRKPKK